MNSSKTKVTYNLNENQSFSLTNSSRELNYIKHRFSNCFKFIKGKNETIIEGKNIVGILDLGNSIYRVYPKVGDILNIFNMINKVSASTHEKIGSEGYLYLDSKVVVTVEDNNIELTDTLIVIFLNELKKVNRIGYTKNYNKDIDNIYFLRGKLDVSKNIKKNILGTKFCCKFNELKFNTPENIILFKTIDKLLTRYPLSKSSRSELLVYKNELLELLDMKIIKNIDMRKTSYYKNRTNQHYEGLMSISNMILNDRFASSLRYGKSQFCNFMIKTDLLFEQYIFLLLQNIIETRYKNYYLKYQYTIDTIAKVNDNLSTVKGNQYLKMNPDILILEKNTDRPVLVIDTKYIDIFDKNKLTNTAYYQMIAYLTSLNTGLYKDTGISAILLAHGNQGNSYKLPNEDCNMYILTKGIDILGNEEDIKKQLDKILEPLL